MKEDGKKRKVIIVAPGRKSEGGIRTVISSIYAILSENSEFDIYWLETHRSGSLFGKLTCLFSAMLK